MLPRFEFAEVICRNPALIYSPSNLYINNLAAYCSKSPSLGMELGGFEYWSVTPKVAGSIPVIPADVLVA